MLDDFAPQGISNTDLVNLLYTNIVGTAPSTSEVTYFTNLIDSGDYSQASLLAMAAKTELNTLQYAGVQSQGLAYTSTTLPTPIYNISYIFNGTDGNDILTGDENYNEINAGAGDDIIHYSGGDDWVKPGEGNDRINVDGNQIFDGGADTLDYSGLGSAITGNLIAGTVTASGKNDVFANISRLRGTDYDDSLTGGNTANDDKESFGGGRGNDIMHGGSGFDELMYHLDQDITQGTEVNFSSGTAIDAYGDNDVFTGMEAVRGTWLSDTFTGNSSIEFIRYRGLAGDDEYIGTIYDENTQKGWDRADYTQDYNYKDANGDMSGTNGISADLALGIIIDGFGDTDTVSNIDGVHGTQYNDIIMGSEGINRLEGKEGDDTLNGREGNDRLVGGEGNDRFIFNASWGNDRIDDFTAGSDKIFMTNTGLLFLDLTIIQENNDTVVSNGQNSITLINTLVSNVTSASFQFNTEFAYGGDTDDTLYGSVGNDYLVGGAGNDIIYGGDGNDVLYGGNNNDQLTGGAGNDQFFFDFSNGNNSGQDTIYDFNVASDSFVLNNLLAVGESFSDFSTLSANHNIAVSDDGINVVVDFNGAQSVTFSGLGTTDQSRVSLVVLSDVMQISLAGVNDVTELGFI